MNFSTQQANFPPQWKSIRPRLDLSLLALRRQDSRGDRRAALVPQGQEALHQVPALERRWLSGGGEPKGSAQCWQRWQDGLDGTIR